MIELIKLTNNKFFDFDESLSVFKFITESKISYKIKIQILKVVIVVLIQDTIL